MNKSTWYHEVHPYNQVFQGETEALKPEVEGWGLTRPQAMQPGSPSRTQVVEVDAPVAATPQIPTSECPELFPDAG